MAPREEARVHHRDGHDPEVALDQIGGYISEKENPENTKQVDLITVELPELRPISRPEIRRYAGS